MNTQTKKLFHNTAVIALIALIAVVFSISDAFAASRPSRLYISPEKATLTVGSTKTIKVRKVKPAKASKAVTYKSSNKKVATVSKTGKVKAIKAGKATITVTSKKNKKVKAKAHITIKAKQVVPKPTEPDYPTITSSKKAIVVYFTHGENMKNAQEYYDSITNKKTETDAVSSATVSTEDQNAAYDAMASASIMRDDHDKLTGTTGVMASWIADMLGTKTVSIQVTDEYLYPQTKKDTQQYVRYKGDQPRDGEQVTGETPAIKPITEDFSQYDVVYLGFPNWDGAPPYAVYSFLNEYQDELNGKTIVPFTSYDNNKYVFSDSINILKSKLPKSPVFDADDGLALLCRSFIENKKSYKSQTYYWVKSMSKKAESAEPLSVETNEDQKKIAQSLVGQAFTKDELIARVGEYTSYHVDTNGCSKNITSTRFFYPGFVIYTEALNAKTPDDVTADTQFKIRSVD